MVLFLKLHTYKQYKQNLHNHKYTVWKIFILNYDTYGLSCIHEYIDKQWVNYVTWI